MKRIKGLAAMLLAVCMIACAAVCVYASNEVVISANGEQTVTAADNLVIDGSECTVKLDNATIGSTGSSVVIKNNSNVTLNLIGESTVTGDSSTESCGIYVEYGSALTIKGSGTLKVTGGKYGAAIGSTVTADGYKAMVKVTSANMFIETAEDKSICYTNYYWNY